MKAYLEVKINFVYMLEFSGISEKTWLDLPLAEKASVIENFLSNGISNDRWELTEWEL